MATEFLAFFQGDGVALAGTSGHSEEIDCQFSSAAPEISTCTSGSSENWMVLSIAGDKPTPRSYVYNSVIFFILYLVIYKSFCGSVCYELLWLSTELILFMVNSMQHLSLRIR